MDLESGRTLRSALLNASDPSPEKVTLPYEEIIRVALLAGYYEESWALSQVHDALRWWRALPEALPSEIGWMFTLRDLEPMWIKERSSGDFVAVHVSADDQGRMIYEVTSSLGGTDSTAQYEDVSKLRSAIAEF